MASDDSLLTEIRRDLLDARPLADVLRKCIFLGTESGSDQLRIWATSELNGYETAEEVPAYRKLHAPIMMDYIAGTRIVKGEQIAVWQLPEIARGAISNEIPMFAGVGKLAAMEEGSRAHGSMHLSLTNWQILGNKMESGQLGLQIHGIYWSVAPSEIAGLLDTIRTKLAELISELVTLVPDSNALPTAEQTNRVTHNLVVTGDSAQVNVGSSVAKVDASAGSTISGVTSGPAAIATGNVDQNQTVAYDGSQNDAIKAWLDEYRQALGELDEGVRPLAEQQIEQVSAELEKDEPQEVVVNTLLTSLKSFATSGATALGSAAGGALWTVLQRWPF